MKAASFRGSPFLFATGGALVLRTGGIRPPLFRAERPSPYPLPEGEETVTPLSPRRRGDSYSTRSRRERRHGTALFQNLVFAPCTKIAFVLYFTSDLVQKGGCRADRSR